MKTTRFSEEQIIAVLREQEGGMKTADVCRKHGISSATLYAWKAKYGGMDVSRARKLKVLEEENGRLKRLLADAMLDNAVLKEVASKNWRDLPLAGELSRMFGSASTSASVGPVPFLPRTGRRYATRTGVVMMATCGRGYARLRPSGGASATVGWASCSPARASS